ncbi:MAG: glycosyltransferase family 4 protein [Chloroflexi bacterium]|nr:glycosyltransferase family 4 protein [Chloroflexota bacterium]
MRIGINALFLQKPATGSGQHLFHLLEGLDAYDKENTYVLLSPRFRRAYAVNWPHLSDRFSNVEVMSALARLGENVEKAWWEQVGLLKAGRAEQIDLLHCPYFASPVTPLFPTVVTIHDVIPLILKEYAWRKLTVAYNALVSFAAKRAQAIIAVSQCSKRDIERTLHIPSDRIHVIGNAVDESFRPVNDAWLLASVRERYNIGERYILYFGGFDVRKNVPRLIRAYAQLPAALRNQFQLVVAGRLHHLGHPTYPDPRPLVRQYGLDGQVIFTGQIRERDKVPLYSGATVFSFVSLYEGFGMPVLEAMACGRPVLTSNTSALPEVVGDAGLTVNPRGETEISEGLRQLLEDEQMRQDLSERALERARFFTWRQVAEQTVEVYRRVGER